MRVKTAMGVERYEVDKTRAFSLDFPEIPEITEILEMGFTKPKSALTSADDARCKERDPSGGAWGGGSRLPQCVDPISYLVKLK